MPARGLLGSLSVAVLVGACSSGSGGDDDREPVDSEPGELVIDGPAQIEDDGGASVAD
jgi:hypothetical protein